jgi:hypothetical protein
LSDIDQFAADLLEEAKRFLGRAKEAAGGPAEPPNLHAALMLGFCSLEAHVNSVADSFSKRTDLSVHERGILSEQDVQLDDGAFHLVNKLKITRLEDRIEFLHQRFGKSGLDPSASWRSALAGAVNLRNKLTHPKAVPNITTAAVESAIQAIIETINALLQAVYGRKFPAASFGLDSKMDF